MYILTDHARDDESKEKHTRSEESCRIRRTCVRKIDEKGRGVEYYHSIELKEPFPRKIVVGWMYKGKNVKIITAYEIKRKWR